ncbi:MAG TPA: hypothetical protein VKA86_06455 [Candidatus Krumholzibacteria bacterium]|nr:hypothetical protein [Candidatus Krumholzibacteria bacterium]
MDSALDAFERTAVDALLAGDHPVLERLRSQMATASVRDREQGEFGRFTDLWVEADPIDVQDRFAIDDVYARVRGVEDEVALLLHVVRGRLKTLEAFVPRPVWPDEPELVETWYVAPDVEEAGQLHRGAERTLTFALRGLTTPREDD